MMTWSSKMNTSLNNVNEIIWAFGMFLYIYLHFYN